MMILAIAMDRGTSAAQESEARYFPVTAHWVTGEFLQAYESAPDPELVFGLPITEQFISRAVSQESGLLVQYFQRARFELHPENIADLRVVISPLGEYLYDIDQPGTPAEITLNQAACKYIIADKPMVCYSFLTFYEVHGGISQFGYPISEVEQRDNLYVQYFQRARFEWHPELPAGNRVVLSNVGERYFGYVEDTNQRWVYKDFIPTTLTLRVNAFVDQAMMAPTGMQNIYVVVQDQNLYPVQGVVALATVKLPDGYQTTYILDPTDENGISQYRLPINDQPFGLAEIEITATAPVSGLSAETKAFFQIWW